MKVFIVFLSIWTLTKCDHSHHDHHDHDHHDHHDYDDHSRHGLDSADKGFHPHSDNEPDRDGDGILILTAENFNKTLSDNDILLVEFYAGFCPHCQDFKPHYAKVAESLKTQPITVAKIDANVEKSLNRRFNVTSIPEILLFKSGEMFRYSGQWATEAVLKFIDAKINGPEIEYIYSPNHAMSLDWNQPMIVIGCFVTPGSSQEDEFVGLYSENLDFPIYITRNETVIKHYKTKDNTVIAVKHFIDDNEVAVYDGKFVTADLKKWAEDNYYVD